MKYYNLDNTRGGIPIGDMAQLGLRDASFTLELWLKVRIKAERATYILGDGLGFQLLITEGKTAIKLPESSGLQLENHTIYDNVWTHLAVVRDHTAERLALYINGQEVATIAVQAYMLHGSLIVGPDEYMRRELGYGFAGSLTELRIWRAALSPGELNRHRFRRLSGTEEDLAFYFPLTEGRGRIALNRALPNVIDADLGAVQITDVNWPHLHASESATGGKVNERIASSLQNEIVADFAGPDREVLARITQSDLDQLGVDFNEGITFEAWIQPRNNRLNAEQEATLFLLKSSDNRHRISLKLANDGFVSLGYFNPETFEEHLAFGRDKQLLMDDWNHIAYSIHPKGGVLLFINGDLIAKANWGVSLRTLQLSEWIIGGEAGNRDSSFAGALAEVRIWRVPLNKELGKNDLIFSRLNRTDKRLLTYLPLNDDITFIPYEQTDATTAIIHFIGLPKDNWPRGENSGVPLHLLSGYQRSVAYFDDSRVVLPDQRAFQIRGQITLEAWVKPNLERQREKKRSFSLPVISRANTFGDGQGVGWELGIDQDSKLVYFSLGLESEESVLRAPTPLEAYTWYHIAGTYDGRQQRLFINGVEVKERSISGQIKLSPQPVHIGCQADNTRLSYQGNMAEVRIWNTRRTAEEIARFMHQPLDMAPKLLANLHFADRDYTVLIHDEWIKEPPNYPNPEVSLGEDEFYQRLDLFTDGSGEGAQSAKAYGLKVDYAAIPVAFYYNPRQSAETVASLSAQINKIRLDLMIALNNFPANFLPIDSNNEAPLDIKAIITKAGQSLQTLQNSDEASVKQQLENLQGQRDDLKRQLQSVERLYETAVSQHRAEQEVLRSQLQGLEAFRDDKSVPVDKFIANIYNSVKETQKILAKTQSNYQLQNVDMDLKVLLVEDGTGIKFPENFEQVNAASLSTMHLTFSPNESLRQIDAPKIGVPDLIGLTEILARRKLTELGLTVKIRPQIIAKTTSSIQKNLQGRIVNQIPKAGVNVALGETIEVFIGKNN